MYNSWKLERVESLFSLVCVGWFLDMLIIISTENLQHIPYKRLCKTILNPMKGLILNYWFDFGTLNFLHLKRR